MCMLNGSLITSGVEFTINRILRSCITSRPFPQPTSRHFTTTTHAILKMIGLEFEVEKNNSLSFFQIILFLEGRGRGGQATPWVEGAAVHRLYKIFTWHIFFGLPPIGIFVLMILYYVLIFSNNYICWLTRIWKRTWTSLKHFTK